MNHTYQESLNTLESLIDYEKSRPSAYTENEYDINGFKRLMVTLGDPQNQFPSIHIAGTKGKGSTSTLIETLLQISGYRTGLYTSPHIFDYVERIKVNKVPIPEELFARYFFYLIELNNRLRPFAPKLFRTVFELLTAMGFLYFKDSNVDVAVVEVGLGGRLDCTNILSPLISVITSLGLDHTAILGKTLSSIAREKGGIIKQGIPVVVSNQTDYAKRKAIPILKEIAKDRNANLIFAEKEFIILSTKTEGKLQKIFFKSKDGEEFSLSIDLLGDHQALNLQTALATLKGLKETGLKIEFDKFMDSTIECHLPGRVEILSEKPIVIFDGAHCPLSVRALCKTIEKIFPGRSRLYLFGILQDKNAREMLRVLNRYTPGEKRIIVFSPPSKRAFDPYKLGKIAEKYFKVEGVFQSAEDAIAFGFKKLKNSEEMLVALGSIYSLAPLKNAFPGAMQSFYL